MTAEHQRLLGRVLGGVYRLDDLIAAGSTSAVFRGTHVRLEQPLAVKVLAGSVVANLSLIARFEAEAKVQAKLRHPNIVAVYDFIADGDVRAIAMEYVDGIGLDYLMYDLAGPMSLDRIRVLMRPVLEAIDHAHAQGIVHRDIKPSNILVTDVAGREFPKVMDFGIAKVLAEEVSQTAPGAMLGTLLFMSPEQCKALKTVDARSDVYSLGVTLYQMATGMVPFYSESAFDIMLAHVQSQPVPPSELESSIPSRLEAVILRALEKEPEDRFQSASEMALALENATGSFIAVNASRAKPAPSPGAPSRAERRAERRVAREPVAEGSDTEVRMADELSSKTLAPCVASRRRQELRNEAMAASYAVPEDLRGIAVPSMDRHRAPVPDRRQPAGPAQSTAVGGQLRAVERGFGDEALAADHDIGSALPYPQDLAHADRLHLAIASAGHWQEYFQANIAGGGVFVPTNEPPPVGATVRLEITFRQGPRLFVSGVVTWRRPPLNDPRARAGVGVQVHPNERGKIRYLNGWADGSRQDQRQIRRIPVKLRVAYTGRTGRRVNFTRDISEAGVFVRSRELLDVGTPTELVLLPDDQRQAFRLQGRVSRQVRDPEDRGMGISLTFASEDERERFAAFVGDLEQRLGRGALSDEMLF